MKLGKNQTTTMKEKKKKEKNNRCGAGDQNYLPQFSEITCPNILAGVPHAAGQGKEARTTSSIYHI